MAVRCMHEATLHEHNSFITLTYDEDHLPHRGQLVRDHWQRFMKRGGKHYGPGWARFYMCGEYGETTGRPHFHACLFGHDWEDKKFLFTNDNGDKVYTSESLERLWGMGQCTTAAVTFESAAYCTRYCMQKRTGRIAEEWYRRWDELGSYQLEPEFGQPSLKPGLGAGWFEKWHTDIYTTDTLVVNGKKTRPTKYYDKLYDQIEPTRMETIKETRAQTAHERRWDNTPRRLQDKLTVTKAATALLQRNKI